MLGEQNLIHFYLHNIDGISYIIEDLITYKKLHIAVLT